MGLTGYPDGQATWLVDEDTVRVAYQSESYATLTSSAGETYPWVMDSGVAFTGSHIHAIDYDRAGLAEFPDHDGPASDIVEASDHLFLHEPGIPTRNGNPMLLAPHRAIQPSAGCQTISSETRVAGQSSVRVRG